MLEEDYIETIEDKEGLAQVIDLTTYFTENEIISVKCSENPTSFFDYVGGHKEERIIPKGTMSVDVELTFTKNPYLRIHEGFTQLIDKENKSYYGFIINPSMQIDNGILTKTKFTLIFAQQSEEMWSGWVPTRFRGK